MSVTFDFTGKVALVTGSSRGIGAGIVRALAAGGAKCVVNYIDDPKAQNRSDAQAVASSIGGAAVIQCDVGEPSQVTAMMRQIGADLGGLDILVNNSGILRDRTIKKMSAAEWDSVIRVNLSGTFHCIQQAAPILRPGGRIVNISSVAGVMGFFGEANYAAGKAGVIALTKVAARELAKQRITVNAVAPGFIDTEMTRGLPPEATRHHRDQIPLGEFGQIDDIAAAVAFLCSPAARYITGHTLHVNGGYYMAQMEHLEGRQSVLAALRARQRKIQVVLIGHGAHVDKIQEVLDAAAETGVPVRNAESRELDSLAHGVTHGGVIAVCSAKPRTTPAQLGEIIDKLSESALLLLLEGVEDARNLGFTIRSAESLGAHAVLIKKHLWDFDPIEIARPASGAYERMPLVQLEDVGPLEDLRRRGVRLVGCIAGARRSLYQTVLTMPTILAIGGEKRGLSGAVRSICDDFLSIPSHGEASSLPLSHAAAIVLAEAMRQRQQNPQLPGK